MEVFGDEPTGPVRARDNLGEGEETQLGVAGADELVRLGNVRADDLTVAHDVFDPERPGRLERRSAVGGERRIRQRDAPEAGVPEGVGAGDPPRVRAEEHEPPHRVGPAAAGNGESLALRELRARLVGREEHLEGSALEDLGVELASRAEAEERAVSGGVLERGGDLSSGRGEVGGHRHRDDIDARWCPCERGSGEQVHDQDRGRQGGSRHRFNLVETELANPANHRPALEFALLPARGRHQTDELCDGCGPRAFRRPVGHTVRIGGVATCAARSVARAGLETGVPSRRGRRRGRADGWRCDVRRAERRACRSGGRRSQAVAVAGEARPGGWRCDVRRAEHRACRSGDRRSKPSRSPERPGGWVAVRRAPRGAPRVPVWRPAFQAGAPSGSGAAAVPRFHH